MRVEKINIARNKTLNRRTRMITDNCKNKRKEAKKICKKGGRAGMEEANKRNKRPVSSHKHLLVNTGITFKWKWPINNGKMETIFL
jgi:hypothetical protein